jgi:hypothetical protein
MILNDLAANRWSYMGEGTPVGILFFLTRVRWQANTYLIKCMRGLEHNLYNSGVPNHSAY